MEASQTESHHVESREHGGEETVSMILKVNASGYSEKMKDAYDHYLEEDLPKMGWSRSHAGHYGSEAYQEGLRRFQESYERMVELNNGTEGLRLNPYMDLDMRDCCGCIMEDEGRCEEDEIRMDLASIDLIKAGGNWLWPSHDCHFELVQQDLIPFLRDDGSKEAAFSQGIAFLLKCTVQSKSCKLRGAEVHLSIDESEAFQFLDIAMPPKGVEFVAPHQIGGVIEYKEGKSWKGLYVEHQTFGTMTCGMLGSKQAFVTLCRNQGIQEVSCLSAIVLVCLSDSERTNFDMFASVEASLSHTGVLKKWRKSNHVHRVGNKKVQLSTFPW